MSLDADSALLCALEVLPAKGDEAANATALSTSEETAQGNDIARLAMDRIGYRGEVRAELSDAAEGPQLTVYVPPLAWKTGPPEVFAPAAFTLNATQAEVCGPGGARSRTRKRTRHGHGWQFRFRASQCRVCPLRGQCGSPHTRGGRTVTKSDYEAPYQAAQQRAPTLEYQAVRREPPRIERKLAEMVRWHAARRGRYRGRLRVKIQYLLTAVVVNCKRIVKLLSRSLQPQLT